ncbi:uncharacterized, partial [Tachysurus ichikawai]
IFNLATKLKQLCSLIGMLNTFAGNVSLVFKSGGREK